MNYIARFRTLTFWLYYHNGKLCSYHMNNHVGQCHIETVGIVGILRLMEF